MSQALASSTRPRTLDESTLLVNRRASFRVFVRIPIRCRRMDARETERVERELQGAPGDTVWTGDPALATWLERIERKLDWLIARVEGRDPLPIGCTDAVDVDLSANGIRLVADAGFRLGEDVLVECLVPDVPTRRVRAIARVVRTAPAPGDRAQVAMQFRVIAERDRASIFRFTQEVQRCRLRDAH